MNSLIKYFWNLVLGLFIGFIVETIWCMIRWKKLESRKGLIYSPLIPIYGLATLFITLLKELDYSNFLDSKELSKAKTTLIAAALTYVASVATTLIQIARLLLMFSGRRDD